MILSEAYKRQTALIVKWSADTAVTRWKGAANWVADVIISHTSDGRRESREVTYRGGVHIEVFIDDDLAAMSVVVTPQLWFQRGPRDSTGLARTTVHR
jgi:hypothetical protein